MVTYIVSIPAGETRYGRYDYGIEVYAPDTPDGPGASFNVVGGGALWKPHNGRFDNEHKDCWWRSTSKGMRYYQHPEFRPSHVVQLDDKNGMWRWQITVPDESWTIKAGSDFYMGIGEVRSHKGKITLADGQ